MKSLMKCTKDMFGLLCRLPGPHLWLRKLTEILGPNHAQGLNTRPSILKPPVGLCKCGLILQKGLKKRYFNTCTVHKIKLGDYNRWYYNQGGLKIKVCKIEGPLY